MCIAVSFLKILNQKITFRSKETLTTKHVLIYSCQIQQDRADFFVTINSIESNKNTTKNPGEMSVVLTLSYSKFKS